MRLWRLFLPGRTFDVVTDSEATKVVLDQNYQKGGGRLLRWSLAASEFDYKVVHRKAARHCDADGLSRFPINEEEPYDEGPTDVEPHNVLLCLPGDNMFADVVRTQHAVLPEDLPPHAACLDDAPLLALYVEKGAYRLRTNKRRTLFG